MKRHFLIFSTLLMALTTSGLASGQEAQPSTDSESPDLIPVEVPTLEASLEAEDAKFAEAPAEDASEMRDEFLKLFSDNKAWREWVENAELDDAMVIRYRRVHPGISSLPGGSKRFIFESQSVKVRDPNLNAEQKLGIMVSLADTGLQETLNDLFQQDDPKQQERTLKSLEHQYTARFEVESAYQDFKVQEIERRVKKLRAEVTQRDEARPDWVSAMVTLAKVKASGIELMPDTMPVPLPGSTPLGGAGFNPSYSTQSTGAYDPVQHRPAWRGESPSTCPVFPLQWTSTDERLPSVSIVPKHSWPRSLARRRSV